MYSAVASVATSFISRYAPTAARIAVFSGGCFLSYGFGMNRGIQRAALREI
jgi:hypothetical protein